MEPVSECAIDVCNLSFDYGGPAILHELNLQLGKGSRCILVGANGAGKTTLLRLLAGKRMLEGHVKVFGKDAFLDAPSGIIYLGTEWANNPVVRADLTVEYLLRSMGANRWPERTEKLLSVLEVDTSWKMHQVSDGQRRRVQLVMGLLQPWQLLLLDEVTVDLDVLARSDLLQFLREETIERQATIVYATHIFDGLGNWPTHIAHIVDGAVVSMHDMAHFDALEKVKQQHRELGLVDSPLMDLCYQWLRQDRDQQRRRKRLDSSEASCDTQHA